MPELVNVDALLHRNDCQVAIIQDLQRRARIGGQARAEKFRVQKGQAKKIARKIWSVEPDLSIRAMASKVHKRMAPLQPASERTIRRWIAPLRPSAS